MKQNADHDQHEAGLLRVADGFAGTGRRQPALALGAMKHRPGGDEPELAA
jgi:hypothetical protein